MALNPDPVMVATEGALWGSVKAHGFLPDTVIVSDDAGQFNVGQHGLCWVHYLENSFIWRETSIPSFTLITFGHRTPHNTHGRVEVRRRVRGRHCRSRCERSRASRRTLQIGNGVLSACLPARCIRLVAAPLLATAVIRAQRRTDCVSLGGTVPKAIEPSVSCRTSLPPACQACLPR